MGYLGRLMKQVVETSYICIQNFFDNLLYCPQPAFAYSNAGYGSKRTFSGKSLENVMFFSRSTRKKHKASQKDDWIRVQNKKSGQVSEKKKKDRSRGKEDRIKINKYEKYSKAAEERKKWEGKFSGTGYFPPY